MKKLFTFCVSLLTALSLSAYDFQSGDLFYNITSNVVPYMVEVTYQNDRNNNNYFGLDSINIPSSITYDGITYQVTSIGSEAFAGCESLSKVVIPNSITTIGDVAFFWCFSLKSISIPNSVTKIGDSAFMGCHSLSSIILPTNLTDIESSAFYNCTSLDSIVIPTGITRIESGAFSYCAGLTFVDIPINVNYIGEFAFRECSSLTSITIPSSVLSIGEETFAYCSSLDAIHVEATIPPVLGEDAFNSTPVCYIPCGTLSAYEASDWAQYVSEFVEEGCIDSTWQIKYTSTDGNIVTPYATDVFGANIVSNIYENGVGTITFDGPVTSIGKRAFYQCKSLTSITIPNSVTSIGDRVFGFCSSLTSITIPENVTSIVSGTFQGCSSIVSIVVDNNNTMYDSRNNCNAIIETATNTLIASSLNTIIPNTVEKIGICAFYGSSIISLDISNSVTSLGDWAFADTPIESITIPNSVTHIGFALLAACNSLTSIVVEEGNSNYDSRDNCNAIIEKSTNRLIATCPNTIIPNTVTTIATRAFQNSAITSIDIPNSVVHIEAYAFRWATQLNSITIPNSVNYIGDSVFYSCPLDTIRMEAMTPPTIGVNPFSSSPVCVIPCGTLAAYEASDWASQVSEFVEERCAPIQMCGDNLYWEYADGVLTITGTGDMYDYAADTDVPWYDVRGNIKTVSLPDAMTKIGQNAFYKCTNMTTINMPTSLIAIGEKAFAQDTKLTGELTLPASLTTIDERAFFNCKAVTAFHIEATTPPTLQDKAFDYVVSPIHVPCGYGHIYGKHAQWGMLNLEMCELLQDNVYYYPIDGHTARAVTYHSNPTDTIVIPSAVVIDGVLRTVTEVADFAFTDCDNLPAIYFNEGLEHIGERAFVRCYGLKGTITLPTTLTTIRERAFSYCDNVAKYLLQAMTPPVLGADVFTGNNKNALFYISCEAMDDYKVATNWSSLKSRLRDACLNIYHYNTPLGTNTNGVYTTEDTLVASIYYRRQFTPYRWETLYLPFEVDRVTVLEDGEEFDLRPWNIITGGDYYLAKPNGMLNLEILFDFTDELEAHTPYIIQFVYDYYRDKIITFYGKESWNKLSTSFEVLSSSAWMQIAGNTTLQDQLLEKPVYMLRSGLDFILQKTTTTLHPFECYVMPYTAQSGAPARMSVRLSDDVATAVESMKGNESRLAYTINGNTLTVYPQGQAFSIYSLNGALIYSCEAGKEAVDCELNSGCYLLHAGTEAHKIML